MSKKNSKNSRRQQLLRQYFLNAYSIALLKQAGDVVASKVAAEGEVRGNEDMVPQAS
ncbi:MAG: hypothetical protein AAGD22_09185 [Verrucomicrobiota bacterium]